MRSETMAAPTALDRVPAGVRQRLLAEAWDALGPVLGLLRAPRTGWLCMHDQADPAEAHVQSRAEDSAARWLAELDALALQPLD
jgi:hypothetical protein